MASPQGHHMSYITIEEASLTLAIEIADDGDVRLLHLASAAVDESAVGGENQKRWFRLVELQVAGENQEDHHGSKYTGTSPGKKLRYVTHREERNNFGRKLKLEQADGELRVVSHLQCFDGLPVVRCWTTVRNESQEVKPLQYVSSFALTGLAKEGTAARDVKSRVWIA